MRMRRKSLARTLDGVFQRREQTSLNSRPATTRRINKARVLRDGHNHLAWQ
jgi:hypothetical protein